MEQFVSNAELFKYLCVLSHNLRERGAVKLAEAIGHASRCAASNISTEFLGESRIALRRVLKEGRGVLKADERSDAKQVLRQLDEALSR